jgi:formate/nitrite transporter FocA (FNT family)
MPEQALPRDIWDQSFKEGERRMNRRPLGQAATGLLGGFEVMIALSVVFTLTGALMTITNEEVAHAIGALPFGIAFVFISIGRSELFTENFLVPVGARFAGRGSNRSLLEMWGLTLLFNFVGLAVVAALLQIDGVLPQSALDAAGTLGDRFAERELGAAIASAIVAGAAMTLYTWMTLAARAETTRVIIALLIGYVLLLPVLNHAVVSGGEILLAVMAGTTHTTPWDVIWRLGVAVAGNTLGGVGLITISRLVQVSGEPHDPEHAGRNSGNGDD